MSEKPRSQRKWLHRAVATVIVLASYFTVHRATCHYEWGPEWDQFGHYTLRVTDRQHRLTNGPFPRWAESFFHPAARFENLTGCLPDPPTCVLGRRNVANELPCQTLAIQPTRLLKRYHYRILRDCRHPLDRAYRARFEVMCHDWLGICCRLRALAGRRGFRIGAQIARRYRPER